MQHLPWRCCMQAQFLSSEVVNRRCRYATDNRRIDFQDTTKLNMDLEEQQTYLQQRQSSQEGASSSNQAGAIPTSPGPSGAGPSPGGRSSSAAGSSYHFICECFFLTAKGLHLGLIKAITEFGEIHRVSIAPCRTVLDCHADSNMGVFCKEDWAVVFKFTAGVTLD